MPEACLPDRGDEEAGHDAEHERRLEEGRPRERSPPSIHRPEERAKLLDGREGEGEAAHGLEVGLDERGLARLDLTQPLEEPTRAGSR
eukprot:12553197-Alexandrium_andersonii.AAC.1